MNGFGKSRSFNHIPILLEIMSLDNLNFGVLRLFVSFLIKRSFYEPALTELLVYVFSRF